MIERKTISVYAYDLQPTVAITYNVSREDVVQNLQWWVREDKKYGYAILRKIQNMMRELELIEPFSELIEKDIFRTYQEIFDTNVVLKNYDIRIDQFNTKKISTSIKPYRNFILTTKDIIHRFIKIYIEKEND